MRAREGPRLMAQRAFPPGRGPRHLLTRGERLTDAMQRQYTALFTDEWSTLVDRLTFQTGTPQDAEDIAGRAFERLLRQLERGTEVDDLRARLNATAQGLLLNHWRDEARRQDVEWASGSATDLAELEQASAQTGLYGGDTSEGEYVVQQPYSIEAADFTAAFDQALRALPSVQRDAVILTDLRGLTQREAATVLDVPQKTLGDRRLAAHTFIREELAG